MTSINGTTKYQTKVSRSTFIKQLAIISAGLLASCTPIKILLKSYPGEFDENINLKLKILNAFTETVIPGAIINHNSSRIFTDEYYPFHEYCGFFAYDLCDRSKNIFSENFYDLSIEERTKVIQNGLEEDSTTGKIYTAAIFITQVSYYCNIYDDDQGCELIDFQGSSGFLETEIFYTNNKEMKAEELTNSGNYI